MFSDIISDHDRLIADYDRLQSFGFDRTDIQELDGIHILTICGEIEIRINEDWIVVNAYPYGDKSEIGRYTAFEADGKRKKLIRALTNIADAVSDFGKSDGIAI